MQLIYLGAKVELKLFDLGHDLWIGFLQRRDIVTLVKPMYNAFRAYGARVLAVETEVIDLLFWMLSTRIPLWAETHSCAHTIITLNHNVRL